MPRVYTHYDNLKVARNAPPEIIRAAYKTLSQKFHPDKNPGNRDAERIMAIINASYEALSDPKRRYEHDLWIKKEESRQETVEENEIINSSTNHKTVTNAARKYIEIDGRLIILFILAALVFIKLS